MILRIRTPSRLHFGLLAGRCQTARSFGGAGLMIDEPAVEIVARSQGDGDLRVTGSPSISPSIIDRARLASSRLASDLGIHARCAIEIRSCPPEHVGLGVGTQLALAIGWAVVRLAGQTVSLERLAQLVGRGRRSAIGIHGFAHGGLLLDGGKGPRTRIAPLLARLNFPTEWPLLLITPPIPQGRHGPPEEDAFEKLSMPEQTSAHLSNILLRRLLPAVLERSLEEFTCALFDYNRTVGQCFSAYQGGVYAHARLEEIVAWLSDQGVPSAQSSWGPTLVAVLDSLDRVSQWTTALVDRFALPPTAVRATFANNTGADFHEEETHP